MHNPTNHLILSSTTIEGTNVRNLADEKLGEIKDIMLDADSGRIVYAVLSVSEGFLGLDNKYFAIPWQALRFDTGREIALLDISKDRLKDSPGFDKDNWPSAPQREFVDEVHTFYGYQPFYNRDTRETSDVNNPSRGTTGTAGSAGTIGSAGTTGTTGGTSYDRSMNDPNFNRDRGDEERNI